MSYIYILKNDDEVEVVFKNIEDAHEYFVRKCLQPHLQDKTPEEKQDELGDINLDDSHKITEQQWSWLLKIFDWTITRHNIRSSASDDDPEIKIDDYEQGQLRNDLQVIYRKISTELSKRIPVKCLMGWEKELNDLFESIVKKGFDRAKSPKDFGRWTDEENQIKTGILAVKEALVGDLTFIDPELYEGKEFANLETLYDSEDEKDEPKKDEPKKDEPKKDETISPVPADLGQNYVKIQKEAFEECKGLIAQLPIKVTYLTPDYIVFISSNDLKIGDFQVKKGLEYALDGREGDIRICEHFSDYKENRQNIASLTPKGGEGTWKKLLEAQYKAHISQQDYYRICEELFHTRIGIAEANLENAGELVVTYREDNDEMVLMDGHIDAVFDGKKIKANNVGLWLDTHHYVLDFSSTTYTNINLPEIRLNPDTLPPRWKDLYQTCHDWENWQRSEKPIISI